MAGRATASTSDEPLLRRPKHLFWLGTQKTHFNHGVTNALSEGFNSKIQSIKSAVRRFRSFKNYHLRILFWVHPAEACAEHSGRFFLRHGSRIQ
ncbi:transposase [Allorhodopirellula solitaria]|uniref:transposase n=1 Tax=Allorhodopirellula solitaria TaxID=2527987 RepID=UPI003703F515